MKKVNTRSLVLLGMLTAVELLFLLTPIGTIPIGNLSITLGVIPVALAAVALGPVGGAAMGAIFGILSFLQCFGIGVLSPMGAVLVDINPVLAFLQRFVPRTLDGFLLGYIYKLVSKLHPDVAFPVTGFFSAFLNTVFFMSALVLCFGKTDYVQGLMGGKAVLAYIVGSIGVNAVCEMIASTVITGAVGAALYHAGLLPSSRAARSKPAETAET